MPTVTITRRGEDRDPRTGIRGSIAATSIDGATPARRDRAGDGPPQRRRSGTRSTAIDPRSRCGCSRVRTAPPLGRLRRGAARRPRSLPRHRSGIDATAYRLVHGEADRLPSSSSIATATTWCVQALSQGDRSAAAGDHRALVERLQPAGILARNDPRVRLLEGLEQHVEVLHGTVPERDRGPRRGGRRTTSIRSAGRRPGLFLDQRENRDAAAALRARPRARRVQLQRRIRAGARAASATRCSPSTSPRTPSRASARTPRATASPTSRRAR